MADKTYLSKEINFNKAPIFWQGIEVYPGGGPAASNLYGTLNVIKNPQEPNTPDINTDGNLRVNLNATINKSFRVNGNTTLNKNVKINKRLLLAKCGDVAKRIDRADKLPSSDKNLKTNIAPIKNSLSKILQLNGVEFDFIDGADTGYLKKHQIGLIAQDVNKVIPEVVGKNNDGTLGVSYQHLVSVLIEAIKEQQQEIEELKKIVSEGK
jgi:hypothetical protein